MNEPYLTIGLFYLGHSHNPDFIPTAVLLKYFLAYKSVNMLRCENIFAPCIWANSELLKCPKGRAPL
jgi:hypothetical protein